MKKIICIMLCALMLTACSAPPAQTSDPNATADPAASADPTASGDPGVAQPDDPSGTGDDPTFYTTADPEYRNLYANNAIEEALDDDFNNAISDEDFNKLATKYLEAWKSEYHALMAQLIESFPDDADDLEGLRDYTDEQAQTTYDDTFAAYTHTDEDGTKTQSIDAVQTASFNTAELYKDATVLSILNDYRGDTPYVFHYSAQ